MNGKSSFKNDKCCIWILNVLILDKKLVKKNLLSMEGKELLKSSQRRSKDACLR